MHQYIKNLIQKWFSTVKTITEAYQMYKEIMQELDKQYKQTMIRILNKED